MYGKIAIFCIILTGKRTKITIFNGNYCTNMARILFYTILIFKYLYIYQIIP